MGLTQEQPHLTGAGPDDLLNLALGILSPEKGRRDLPRGQCPAHGTRLSNSMFGPGAAGGGPRLRPRLGTSRRGAGRLGGTAGYKQREGETRREAGGDTGGDDEGGGLGHYHLLVK